MQTLHPDLFPETLLVESDRERAFTTSIKVAEHFGKRHTNVLRAINDVLACTLEPGHRLNFEPMSGLDERNRKRPYYNLTRDGFVFIVHGFTGPAADEWKWKFLDAFKQMEAQLIEQTRREASALFKLRPRWQPIVLNPGFKRAQLLPLTGHASAGSITACRRRMREMGVLV